MTPIIQEINLKINEILENEKSATIVNQLEIHVSDYYFIMKYALPENELKQHQIRPYIRRLIKKDRERWEKEHGRMIEFNPDELTIKEVEIKKHGRKSTKATAKNK